MFTDSLPEKALLRAAYQRSNQLCSLEVPADDHLRTPARSIEEALNTEQSAPVRKACLEFLTAAAAFYGVSRPPVRVLAARPLRMRENRWATELFGDYHLEQKLIRVWMRTAVQKRVASFGTFLATLCHEFCHHLDCERFGFRDTPHTRRFYERAAAPYHHARSTPAKRLFWARLPNGRRRIDWPRTNRGG